MPREPKSIQPDIALTSKALPPLTIELLLAEAKAFAAEESQHKEPSIYGATDGKALGTYLEQKFTRKISAKYFTNPGNSALGIDLPGVNVDIKTTFISQPQSSCPFSSARQKVLGLGYSLLVFVYEKTDDAARKTATLRVLHTVFVEKERTADYTLTRLIRGIVEDRASDDDAKEADLLGLFQDKNLPIDSTEAKRLAREVIASPPPQGYLTISNALQWRLQYQRVITEAGKVDGIHRVS